MSKFKEKVVNKAIRSKNIFPNSDSDPIDGYILIECEKILEIIPYDKFHKKDLSSSYFIIDYEDYYIFPGIIDSNIHTNSNFDPLWRDHENITKMAIKGGITTIIDNPIMNKHENSEKKNIENRILSLEKNLFSDCALLAFLGPQNINEIEEIINLGVFGFKSYLAPSPQKDLDYFNKESICSLDDYLSGNPSDHLFVFNCILASERDLFLSSPCRAVSLDKRINLKYNIGDLSNFGGGFNGNMDDEMLDSSEIKQKECFIDLYAKKLLLQQNIPTTAALKVEAMIVAQETEIKNITQMEKMQYCNYDKEELEEEIKKDNEEDLDSELALSSKLSDDFKMDKNIVNENSPNKPANNNSCPNPVPLINERGKSKTMFIMNPMKSLLKNLAMDGLNDSKANKEQNLVKFEDNNNENPLNSEESEDTPQNNKKRWFSKSPIKKQSGLLDRRKTNKSIQFQKPEAGLTRIETSTKIKQDEKEGEKTRNYITFLSNHPVSLEYNGLKTIMNIFYKNKTNRFLISNLSSSSLAFEIRDLKRKVPNFQIFSETCIPYIFFNSSMIEPGRTKYKNSPPIRDKKDSKIMLESMKLGVIDIFSSFHLQAPDIYKNIDEGNFRRAFSSNSCVGYNLQVLWTKLFCSEKRKIEKKIFNKIKFKEIAINIFKKIILVLSVNPAKIFKIDDKKGSIEKGKDADFFIWDPWKIEKVEQDDILLKNPRVFVLRGFKLYGDVKATFLRGQIVFKKDMKDKDFIKRGKIIRKSVGEEKKN